MLTHIFVNTNSESRWRFVTPLPKFGGDLLPCKSKTNGTIMGVAQTAIDASRWYTNYIDGGFNIFLCSHRIRGKLIQFDLAHIFQMG